MSATTYADIEAVDRTAAVVRSVVASMTLPANMRFISKGEIGLRDDDIHVTLLAEWDDIYHPGRPVQTYTTVAFPPIIVSDRGKPMRDWIEHRLYEAVRKLWMHELHEHVKFNGKHHVDPHPPDGGFQ